jgi:peptidyl-Lys metalloendopeptidase
MMRAREVKTWLLVVMMLVVCASAASAATAGTGGLAAAISADRTFLTGAESAVVRVELRNDSKEDLYLPYWQTAVRGIHGNLFDVSLGGRAVAYIGRLVKWGLPKAEDYVRIQAGRTLTVEVDLSRYYDLSRTGEYAIQYRVPVQDAFRGVRPNASDIAEATGLRGVESNVLHVGVERDQPGRFVQQLAQDGGAGIDRTTGNYLTPGYVSCTSTRQSQLLTALGNAETLSRKSRDYLNNLPVASRSTDTAYKTWFGAYTSSRYSTVQSHYTSIYSAFNTKTVQFYCDCTDSSYAYVYSNQPYKIHLCNAFWSAPTLGTDSKAGTLVHEMSHFNVTAGTSDYAYGQSACKSLATSNPSRAISNADSHEYFAESR